MQTNQIPIRLRPLTAQDTDVVYAMTSDPRVAQFMRFGTHTAREEAAALIQAYTAGNNQAFLILEQGSGAAVGVAAMKEEADVPGRFSLSTFNAPQYWNRGYASHVLALLVERARESGIRALSAYVVGDNAASRRVLEKAGFAAPHVQYFDDLPSGLFIYTLALS